METESDELKTIINYVLRHSSSSATVVEISVTKPDLRGEHLLSTIEKVRVDFQHEEPAYYFVKKRLKFPSKSGADTHMKFIMKKEGEFLTSRMDEMRSICLRSTSKSLLDELVPAVFYQNDDLIVMEDLAIRGYSIQPKTEKLDFNQAGMVVTEIAKFHAVSYGLILETGGVDCFLQKFPEYEPNLPKPEGKEMISLTFGPIFEKVLHLLKNSKREESQRAHEFLGMYEGKLEDALATVVEADTLFFVLCHGDLWNNNIMFHNGGQKLKFVDFQLVQVGSPNLDLGYFIFTSTKKDARQRWKELLDIYLKNYLQTLSDLGYSLRISVKDLIKDYSRKSELGFIFAVFSAVTFEAISDYDPANGEATSFAGSMNKWIEENPSKSEEICKFIIAIVDDYMAVVGKSTLKFQSSVL